MNQSKGLQSVYDTHRRGLFSQFKPGSIEGYPTVATSPSTGNLPSCSVHVGISDSASFTVAVRDVKDRQKACEAGKELGTSAIDKLSG